MSVLHYQAGTLFQALQLVQNPRPVYIDLDFTLLRTSSLYFFFPQALKYIPFWIWETSFYSWSCFKEYISARVPFQVQAWPYRPVVLEFINLCQAHHIPCFLATGAHRWVAQKVNTFLGCFQDVFGSTRERHLVGQEKARLLLSRGQPFTYLGDSTQDFAVWQNALEIVALNPSFYLQKRLEKCALDWSKPLHLVYDQVS